MIAERPSRGGWGRGGKKEEGERKKTCGILD